MFTPNHFINVMVLELLKGSSLSWYFYCDK